jgi:serine/threonine protein kinase
MLEPNTLLQNRYLIGRHIGQGGMGAVYEARDQRLGNTVALKQTLDAGEQFSRAFEREARLLASLRHPALPRVIDHFVDGGGQFLVMEFVPGDDLAAMLKRRSGPFPLDQALGWADQLLDALDYMHTQQPPVIHRDIKPQNLKLTARGEIILLDFGLAKGMSAGQSQAVTTGSIFGYTPQYAPLEQIQGAGTDPRSDLYSLAATLYHLLTGWPPANALTRASAVIARQPDPLRPAHEIAPELPPAVGAALMQALALDPEERPASAAVLRAMLHDIRQAADSLAIHSRPTVFIPRTGATVIAPPRGPSPAVQAPAPLHRGPWLWAIGGGAIVVLALVGMLALLGGRGGQGPAGSDGPTPTAVAQAEPTQMPTVQAATSAPPTTEPSPLPTTISIPTASPSPPSPAPPAVGEPARTHPGAELDLWTAAAGGERVRERPKLYGGALVTVVAIEPAAVRVRTPEGVEGWIQTPAAEALTGDLAAPGPAERFGAGTRVAIVWANGIPLRQEPRSNATPLVEKLPAGQQGTVQEVLGDWLKVTLDDQTTGWARWYYDGRRYISIVAPPPRFTQRLLLQDPRISGADVQAVQQRLHDLGYVEIGQIDGVFGSDTETAVKNFQAANQLDADGIVGPETWDKLFGAGAVRKP